MEAGLGVCALCPLPDCNSNKCRMVDSQQSMLTSSSHRSSSCSDSLLHDSGDYQWCLDYAYNRDGNSKKHQGVLSYHENEISAYDDISKNIDANLAEIDMETFRSEDIHSILALPTIFCAGEFENSHGEKCASVSGSLSACLEIDSSVSPASTSEDDCSAAEMSICKDEPLFSPVKEHTLPLGTISTDSLDCNSFEEHDLVLTCRANKNNYTIAFEGSSIQFSDDSDYPEVDRLGESCPLQETKGHRQPSKGHSMIHSDLGFTTWSKLRRVKESGKNAAGKSQSLPNLLRQSSGDRNSWDRCMPLYDVQKSQTDSTDSHVSLIKLFIRHKQSNSLSMSSSQSNSANSSDLSSSNVVLQEDDKEESVNAAYLYQNNFADNEANNNNTVQKPLDNNNVETTVESDEDNSLYFEDSLVETRTVSNKTVCASPIREEEEPLETDSSSSDATMRDSKDPFASESSEEVSLGLNRNKHVNRKSVKYMAGLAMGSNPVNLSQATQTRQVNDDNFVDGPKSVDLMDREVQGDNSGSQRALCTVSLSRSSSVSGCSSSGQKKFNVSLATTRTCGTQIPVHIRDQEVQTNTEIDTSDSWTFTMKDDSETGEFTFNEVKEPTSGDRRSIYICYPNYSLPDLSFLRKMTASPENGERVIMKPTRHRLPEKQPARRRSYSSEGKSRPRSCGDCIAGQSFSHIQDWDSLKTLLPAEYRGIVAQMQMSSEAGVCQCDAKKHPPPIPERSMSLPVSEPSRRSILRKSSSASHCTNVRTSYGPQKCQSSPSIPCSEEAAPKRLSLQEPFQCLLDNIPEAAVDGTNVESSAVRSQARGVEQQCIVGNRASHQLSRAGSDVFWGRTCPCSLHRQDNTADTAAEVHRLLQSDASLNLAAALLSGEDSGYEQHCGCSRNKKTVSFCENVDVHFRGHHHNCPKVEACAFPCPGSKADTSLNVSRAEAKPGSITHSKSIYLQRIKLAVTHILEWFSSTQRNDSSKPPLESVVVSLLCPALYALLADGLLTSVQGLFGPLSNNPWRIAETSCQHRGNDCKELLELLAYVNGEDSLKNHVFKFNAFILGLLNLPGLLEQWLLGLLSSPHFVQRHYTPTGFLFLTSLPQFVGLRDDLLHYLRPLTYLAFSLDIHAAASVSPTEFVSACQRHDDDDGSAPKRRTRPTSCIEVATGDEHPPHPTVRPSNSWECGGSAAAFDENLNATAVLEEAPKYSPATSGDSGCSSPPPEMQDGDSFQQLRQKWAQLEMNASSGKPPLPNSPFREASTPTKSRKKTPRSLRSKLPSPVRNSDNRPTTPESPLRQRTSSPPAVGCGRSSRRSFIPVHRPGARGGSGKRQ